jgi:hypothetical protein
VALEGVVLNPGTAGATVATDTVGGLDFQVVKIAVGADGTANLVANANPIPVSDAGASLTVDGTVDVTGSTVAVSGTVTVGSHAVTNAGVFATQVDGAALTALQLIDNLVLAEDAVHASGDPGLMALAVRRDANTSLVGTDGDYSPIQVNAAGSVKVAVTSGGITGVVEDAAAAGGEEGVLAMAVRQDTLASSTSADGDFTNLKVNAAGALYVSGAGTTQYTEDAASAGAESLCLVGAVRRDAAASSAGTDGDYATLNTDATGNLRVTTNTQYTEDVPSAGGELLTLAGAIRSDAANSQAGTNGDYSPLITDANGRLHVIAAMASAQNIATIGTSIVPGVSATHLGKAEDAAHASGDTGVAVWAVRTDTLAASSGTTGDYEPFHTDSVGALWTRSAGELVDDAAFTPGTSRVMPMGMQADETATDSVDEGDVGAPRMTLDRKQIVTTYAHAAAGGATPFRNIDVDESEDDVKTSAGKLFSIHVMNLAATKRFLKIYDSVAATVVVGTTVPVLEFPIPTMADTNGAGFVMNFGTHGCQFATGICIAATTGLGHTDTGAPGTNEVVVNGTFI